jgi:hypothetical protein
MLSGISGIDGKRSVARLGRLRLLVMITCRQAQDRYEERESRALHNLAPKDKGAATVRLKPPAWSSVASVLN